MYIFYVDECGRPSLEDKSLDADPWFVMAAVGIHSSQWLMIDSDMTRIKQKYFPGIKPINIEFKSTNIRSAGGPYPRAPFSSLKKDVLVELVEELYQIYDTYNLTIFSVAIQRKEHKMKYEANGKRPEFPYQLAFKMLIERIDWFLENLNSKKTIPEREFGFVILDEYVGQYKVTRSNLLWYQESGTFQKKKINYVKEVPFFNVSRYSQLLALPDLVAYNVYHRFRYEKPNYPFYQRIKPHFYRKDGRLWGYGLKRFPTIKAPPGET